MIVWEAEYAMKPAPASLCCARLADTVDRDVRIVRLLASELRQPEAGSRRLAADIRGYVTLLT